MPTVIPAAFTQQINRFALETMKGYKPKFTQFMHMGKMDSDHIDVVGLVGYNLPSFRFPREGVKNMQMSQGFTKRYVSSIYAGMDSIALEDLENDMYGILHKEVVSKGSAMAHAFMIQQERAVAAMWSSLGFASTSPFTSDGLGLFSTTHPVAPNTTATAANMPSVGVSLSVTSFRNMTTNLMTQPMPDNVSFFETPPAVLVCHPSQRNIAYQLTKQMYEPNSADRNVNVASMDNIRTILWPYFQQNGPKGAAMNPLPYNGWFVLGKRHFAHFYTRAQFKIKTDTDIRVNSLLIMGQCQYAYGADDWRGLYGSTGE